MIRETWHRLSGLPQYGVDLETGEFACRSYVLYRGRTPREEIGPWHTLGVLDPSDLARVAAVMAAGESPDAILDRAAVACGSLTPETGLDGTPHLVRDSRAADAAARRAAWLADAEQGDRDLAVVLDIAERMEREAIQIRRDAPGLPGGSRDYHLRQTASALRRAGRWGLRIFGESVTQLGY